MSMFTLGRDVVENNIKSIRRLPFPDKMWCIPVPFVFPGKKIQLPLPNLLILSVYINRPEILQYFLDHNADANCIHKPTGWAPIHFAAFVNDVAMMRVLIDHGADVNMAGHSGETPLCVALATNKPAAVVFLLENGASAESGPEAKPIQLAVESGSKDMIALLLRKGVSTLEVDYSQAPDGAELREWMLSEEWKTSDEYDPDVIADRYPAERIEDVLEFTYPECPEINTRTRYTDRRYVADIKERNRCLRDESVSDTSSDESGSEDDV